MTAEEILGQYRFFRDSVILEFRETQEEGKLEMRIACRIHQYPEKQDSFEFSELLLTFHDCRYRYPFHDFDPESYGIIDASFRNGRVFFHLYDGVFNDHRFLSIRARDMEVTELNEHYPVENIY